VRTDQVELKNFLLSRICIFAGNLYINQDRDNYVVFTNDNGIANYTKYKFH